MAKLSADGASLVYSTYLGEVLPICIRYRRRRLQPRVRHWPHQLDELPRHARRLSNEHRWLCTRRDAFVAKLSADGASLVYSTYLGGNSAMIMATASPLTPPATPTSRAKPSHRIFPSRPAPIRPSGGIDHGLYDAFVAKLSVDGASLIYSTYLGGSDSDDLWQRHRRRQRRQRLRYWQHLLNGLPHHAWRLSNQFRRRHHRQH